MVLVRVRVGVRVIIKVRVRVKELAVFRVRNKIRTARLRVMFMVTTKIKRFSEGYQA